MESRSQQRVISTPLVSQLVKCAPFVLLGSSASPLIDGLKLITGKVPFAGLHQASVVRAILFSKPPPFPSAPRSTDGSGSLWRFSLRCREADPTERPTANQIRTELANYVRHEQAVDTADATGCNQEAPQHAPGHQDRSGTLTDLTPTFQTRDRQVTDRGDHATVITYHEEALQPGHPDRSSGLELEVKTSTEFIGKAVIQADLQGGNNVTDSLTRPALLPSG